MNLGAGFFGGAARRALLYQAPVAAPVKRAAVLPYRQPVARNILGRKTQMHFGQVPFVPVQGASTQPAWLTAITEFAKQALPVYQQAKILSEQEKRRRAGLPPLDSEQLAPTVRVQAGLDPQITKMVMWGGMAIGGALLLMTLSKRR